SFGREARRICWWRPLMGTKVAENSWGGYLGQYPSALLNHQNFADTIGKPTAVCLRVNKRTVFCRNIQRHIQRYWISRRICRSISCSAATSFHRSASTSIIVKSSCHRVYRGRSYYSHVRCREIEDCRRSVRSRCPPGLTLGVRRETSGGNSLRSRGPRRQLLRVEPISQERNEVMATYIFSVDSVEIHNQKADTDHSDSDWLSFIVTVANPI